MAYHATIVMDLHLLTEIFHMRKLLFLLSFLTIFTNIGFAQNQEKTDIATLKLNLPEFRNASFWLGRTGLTLFSDDGKYVAVSAKTADVAIYDTNTGNLVSKIDGKGFWAFSFSPDGKNVIVQKGSSKFKEEIIKNGFNLIEVETTEFMKSGGSVFCMKLMYY